MGQLPGCCRDSGSSQLCCSPAKLLGNAAAAASPARPDAAEPPWEQQHPTPARGPCALGRIPAQAERDAGQVTGMVKHIPAQPSLTASPSPPSLRSHPAAFRLSGLMLLAPGMLKHSTEHSRLLILPLRTAPGGKGAPWEGDGESQPLTDGWRSRGSREVTPTPPSPPEEGSAALGCRCPAKSRGT